MPAVAAGALVALAALDGGLYSDAVVAMPFVPLIATLYLDRRAAIAAAGAIGAVLTLFFFRDLLSAADVMSRSDTGLLVLRYLFCVSVVLFGAVLGWLYERNQARDREAIERSHQRADALLAAIPDALYRVTSDGRVLDARPSELPLRVARDARLPDQLPLAEAGRLDHQISRAASSGEFGRGEFVLPSGGVCLDLEIRTAPHGEGEALAIVRDITRQRQVQRLQEEFISTVSHELRTPLTSLHAGISLVAGEALGELPPDALEILGLALHNSERLRRLIDDLLDVQKLQGGHMEMQLEPTCLDEALRRGVQEQRAFARQRGVSLSLEPAPAVEVLVDPMRFQQVLANLLSNALKYSPAGQTVRVSADRRGDAVRIAVADSGQGISEAFQPRVFERFAMADASTTRAVGGTGLGLAISRHIVQGLGGEIDFQSVEGVGTTFYVDLPIHASDREATAG